MQFPDAPAISCRVYELSSTYATPLHNGWLCKINSACGVWKVSRSASQSVLLSCARLSEWVWALFPGTITENGSSSSYGWVRENAAWHLRSGKGFFVRLLKKSPVPLSQKKSINCLLLESIKGRTSRCGGKNLGLDTPYDWKENTILWDVSQVLGHEHFSFIFFL